MTEPTVPQPPAMPPEAPAPPMAPPPVAPAAPAAPQYAAPQPVAPQYNYVPGAARPGPTPGVYFANNGPRFIAYLIDGFVLGVVATALYFAIGLVGALIAQASNDLGVLVLGIGWLVVALVSLAWFPYWWSKSGQTPGLKVMHLKVVREADGGLLGFGGGFLRLIGYWVSAFVFYLGFIWILVDNRRQGWHDKIAKTFVIEVP